MAGHRSVWTALAAVALTVPALVANDAANDPAVAAQAASVTLVVGAPGALTSGDAAVRSRLQGAGYSVVVADDNTVTAAGAASTTFAIITSSVTDSVLGSRLTAVATPLWVAKPYLFDNYGLAGPTGEVDYGSRASRTIDVVAPDHPLAAGRAGTVTIQTGTSRVSFARRRRRRRWSRAAARRRRSSRSRRACRWPVASRLPAAGCRMSFPIFANAPTTFTADGWAMFDAAALWAAGGCASGPVDAPPTVTITSPPGGSTVTGTITVTATATDDVGISSVGFAIDGDAVGLDQNGADGWSTSWNTTAVADGSHVVSATATDSAGKTATTSISVTVANSPASDAVLFVVGAPAALTSGEVAVRSRPPRRLLRRR